MAMTPSLPRLEFVAMAIGALEKASTPSLFQPFHVRQRIGNAGSKQEAVALGHVPVGQRHLEGVACSLRRFGRSVDPAQRPVSRQLLACTIGDLSRIGTIVRQEAMGVAGEAVSTLPGIDDENLAPRAEQLQGRGHSGIAAADDDNVKTHYLNPSVRDGSLPSLNCAGDIFPQYLCDRTVDGDRLDLLARPHDADHGLDVGTIIIATGELGDRYDHLIVQVMKLAHPGFDLPGTFR